MQQRLVLSRNALRCRDRRHWLHALALRRQQQADAIGLERSHPIRVTNNARYFLDVSRKTFIAPLCQSVPHFSPLPKMWRTTYMIPDRGLLRRVDSVAVSDSVILTARRECL